MFHDGQVPGQRPRDDCGSRALDVVPAGAGEESHDQGEVLGGHAPTRWERWWLSLPAHRRRAARLGTASLVGVALAATGAVAVQGWMDERDRRRAVSLAVAVGAWTSSHSPPGGQVTYYLAIKNDGPATLEVVSVAASGDRLRLRSPDDVARRLEAGRQVLVPMSALLTCSTDAADATLQVQIDVRRGDGSVARHRSPLGDAMMLLGAADTLCQVRPALTDYELSGPVLRPAPTDRGEG